MKPDHELTISEANFIRISYGVVMGGATSVIFVVMFLFTLHADSKANMADIEEQSVRIEKIEERYIRNMEKQNERLREIERVLNEMSGYLKRQSK